MDLMYLESEAIISTMLRLMLENGLVSLSVHDSFIVPRGQLANARKILSDEYRCAVGVVPHFNINAYCGVLDLSEAIIPVSGRGRQFSNLVAATFAPVRMFNMTSSPCSMNNL